jgi:fructose 1,6-bisphosphatase
MSISGWMPGSFFTPTLPKPAREQVRNRQELPPDTLGCDNLFVNLHLRSGSERARGILPEAER